jgi:hypothetical protein
VVYSSSFEGAKIVANVKSGILNKLQAANNAASLRFCFTNPETDQPVTFFVAVRVNGNAPYKDSKDMAIFTLQFTQRPPDDLIQIMGRLLDANINSVKRKDERVVLSNETVRRLKILTKDIAAFIQGVPRRCILREISFGGAKLVIMGVAKFLVEKDSALRLDFEDPRESFLIKGKFTAADPVEGRQDLLAVDIEFTEQSIPLGYKIRLNDFLSQIWADSRTGEKQNAAAAKKPEAPQKSANQNTADALQTMKKNTANPEAGAAKPEADAAPPAPPKDGDGKPKPPPAEKTLGTAPQK